MSKVERIQQLDYLKGILIILMVSFHNQDIKDNYPLLVQAIYTFHIPAFLIISGYLSNVEKDESSFTKGMMRFVVPYVTFELAYVIAIFFLGRVMNTSNDLVELSPLIMLDKVMLNPIGTYWYIHTLIICNLVYYVVYRVLKLKDISAMAIMGIALFGLSLIIGRLEMCNVIYFLIGVFIARNGKDFMTMIKPSALAAIPLCVLFLFPDNFDRGTLPGVIITILVISFLLFWYEYCPYKARDLLIYLGRNSLAVVIFSPIFTVTCTKFIPYFKFDPTHLLFTFVLLSFTLTGCIFCAWMSDKLHVSRFLFLKDKLYVEYKNNNLDNIYSLNKESTT